MLEIIWSIVKGIIDFSFSKEHSLPLLLLVVGVAILKILSKVIPIKKPNTTSPVSPSAEHNVFSKVFGVIICVVFVALVIMFVIILFGLNK